MDLEDTTGLSVTRRQALAGAGALTLGVGGGAAAVSDLFASDEPYDGTWVARNNYYYGSGGGPRDENLFAISADTRLQYLDVSWEPFGNPVGGGSGCWEHTFVLHSSAFAVQPRRIMNGSPMVPDWVDFVPADGNSGGYSDPIEIGSELAVRSEDDHEAVSVSARRDGDLYHFVDPNALTEHVRDNPALANAHSYDSANGDSYEDLLATTPGTDVNWVEAKMKEEAEDREAYLQAGMSSLGLALFATGALAPLGTALFVASAARGLVTLLLDAIETPDDGVAQNRGFSNSNPKKDACTGHFVMFDVCVAPNSQASFTVESRHPLPTGFRSGPSPKWEVKLPSRPKPESNEDGHRRSAWIDSADDSVTNVDTDPSANVAIGPSPGDRTAGTELSFSGVNTLRGGAMIDEFGWAVYEYSGDPGSPVPDNASPITRASDPAFSRELDAGQYVVRLSVTDMLGNEDVALKPFEVGSDERGPEARLDADLVDAPDLPDVVFDGRGSTDDLGIVEHQWDAWTMPPRRNYGRPTTLRVPLSEQVLDHLPNDAVRATLTVWDRAGRSSTTTKTVSVEGGER